MQANLPFGSLTDYDLCYDIYNGVSRHKRSYNGVFRHTGIISDN